MDGIDRRQFLKRSGALGGAIAAAPVLSHRAAFGAGRGRRDRGSILDLPAKESPVSHVVVLMMENRSFDHYLGWLTEDETYIEKGRSRFGTKFQIRGDQHQSFLDPEGKRVPTYYLPDKPDEENPYRGCHHPDPGHGWESGRVQRDEGFLADGSGNDEFAIGYYTEEDIPLYAQLARRFTIFDRYHCSLLGPTFPNREYLHSAQSGGNKKNDLPIDSAGFQWETIWDKLQAAGVPIGYYYVDLPTTALWGARTQSFSRHIEAYFSACASGTLPNVSFLDPGFTTGLRTDDHPYADIRAGQNLVHDYVKAFVDSPHWESGVFFITYDEWGGFFDHVAPPRFPDDRASAVDEEDFGQSGFRVPTLMASPYARRGYVDGRAYEHTSILRFIQWRYLGAPAEGPGKGKAPWALTTRDRNALNIGASLKPTHPRPEFELSGIKIPVTSEPCEGEELEGLPLPGFPEVARPDLTEEHAFEKALNEGYFERVGWDIELKPIPTL